jgi:hypothetical protein
MPESLFDKWMGYSEKSKSRKLEQEDLEADAIFEGIQEYMDQRRKRITSPPSKPLEKRPTLTAGAILSDLKPALSTVTEGNS